MGEIISFNNVLPEKEIFSIDKERGILCFHIGYTNIVVLAWITNPLRKSPGFLPNTHKIRHDYPDFSLWCAELIEILTREIPIVIEMHFKLKYRLFIYLFQPQTDIFSTRALILVHFKNVHYFSQPSFSLFSYLKNV